MTMASLIALGAPPLPERFFYRVRSDVDGFVFVQIRCEQDPPAWWPWWRSRRVVEVLAPRTDDPNADVREGCVAASSSIENRLKRADYWSGLRRLEGDHR